MNNLDKLFEHKLSEHAIEPSTNAWSRIAENLPKKNRRIVWFRAAAGLGIAGLAVVLWYYSNSTDAGDNRLAEDANAVELRNEIEPSLESNAIQQANNKPEEQEKVLLANKEDKIAKQNHKSDRTVRIKENSKSEKPVEVAVVNPVETSVEKILLVENKVIEAVAQQDKPIVIVYELKPMRVPENPMELDLAPQRKSGLKKVLEIANDVRRGESPLGGLRQAKEEILAFNFKKEDKNNIK